MPRRYDWPDPRDRSPNDPYTLLKREAVIDLYRQVTNNENVEYLTDVIKDWFESEAKAQGWDEVIWADQCAILKKVWS